MRRRKSIVAGGSMPTDAAHIGGIENSAAVHPGSVRLRGARPCVGYASRRCQSGLSLDRLLHSGRGAWPHFPKMPWLTLSTQYLPMFEKLMGVVLNQHQQSRLKTADAITECSDSAALGKVLPLTPTSLSFARAAKGRSDPDGRASPLLSYLCDSSSLRQQHCCWCSFKFGSCGSAVPHSCFWRCGFAIALRSFTSIRTRRSWPAFR